VPIGWLSDRMDRRWLILGVSAVGAVSTGIGAFLGVDFRTLLVLGFLMGGMALPLYSLFIAYTNDFLAVEDMAAASGGLVFVYGLGAIFGPFVIGQMMSMIGPEGFWLFLSATFTATVIYAAWRMTRRPSVPVDETGAYLGVSPTSSPVAVAAAQDWYVETAESEDSAEDEKPAA